MTEQVELEQNVIKEVTRFKIRRAHDDFRMQERSTYHKIYRNGELVVYITCPDCREVCILTGEDFKINEETGEVDLALKCPQPFCEFVNFITLENWFDC